MTAQSNISSKKGFTLIELLVVITILAVLAVIGFAAYRGFTTKGNDARRLEDLKAIGDALEANKTTAGYQPLAITQFANGSIPVDPRGSTVTYCMDSTTNATPVFPTAKPGAWTTGTCGSGVKFNGGASAAWTAVAVGAPTAGTTAWQVCATMEDGTTVNCRNSAQ